MSWLRICVIFGSMAPLAMLTAFSVREALQTAEGASSTSGASAAVPARPATLEEIAEQRETDHRVLKWLAEGTARPLDRWPAPPAVDAESTWMTLAKDDRSRWEASSELAREWSGTIAATDSVETAEDDAGLEEAADKLTRLRDTIEARASRVTQTTPLRELVDRRLARIRELTEDGKAARANRDVLRRAEQAYKAGQYAESLKICNEWKGPRSAQIDALETAARYHFEGEPLRLKLAQAMRPSGKGCAESTPAWNDLMREVEQFLTRYPEAPPQASPTLDQALRQGLKRMQLLIAIEAIPRVAPRNTSQMVATIQRILAESPDETVKDCMAASLRAWVGKGLPSKSIPVRTYQYAVDRSSNALLEGQFVLAPGGASYRYRRLDPTGPEGFADQYDPIPLPRLKAPPTDPPDKSAATDYQAQRETLARSIGRIEVWQAFQRRCEQYEAKLAQYAQLGGKVDVSFAVEAAFAADMLRSENWAELEPLLSR